MYCATKRRPWLIRVRSQFALPAGRRRPPPSRAPGAVALLFYDAAPVLFPRLSETKLLAYTTHWPHTYLLRERYRPPAYFSEREKQLKPCYVQINRWDVSITALFVRRRSPERRTRWIAVSTRICIPCLSPRSLGGKNTAISLGSVQRGARISYSPLRPANTIICRFGRDALFSIPLFSKTSAPCFSE